MIEVIEDNFSLITTYKDHKELVPNRTILPIKFLSQMLIKTPVSEEQSV